MSRKPPSPEATGQKGPWQKSATPNLYRFRTSGTYFARAKVGGKLFRKSLETTVYSVACLRLRDALRDERARVETAGATLTGPSSFGQAADQLMREIDGNPALKPSTKFYRRRCLNALLRSWPELAASDIRRVTVRQCQEWATGFAADYSSTTYNNTVGTLRMVFEEAVKSGVRLKNPADQVHKVKVRPKQLNLPTPAQFSKLVQVIAERGGRFSRACAALVEFLAYGGFRKGEAAFIRWADCNFEKKKMLVAGDPKLGTKNREVRDVPMNPSMLRLLDRLRGERLEEPAASTVMKVRECQKAIDQACKLLSIPRFTHHDLRHFFATSCIEAGIDIPTVSRWLGHKDGGALAMRVYGHLRDHHSQAMAEKVAFGDEVRPLADDTPQASEAAREGMTAAGTRARRLG